MSDDVMAYLTDEDKKRIAARIYRESAQRVVDSMLPTLVREEAARVLPALVTAHLQKTIANLVEHPANWMNPIASALTKQARDAINEGLRNTVVRFEPKKEDDQ